MIYCQSCHKMRLADGEMWAGSLDALCHCGPEQSQRVLIQTLMTLYPGNLFIRIGDNQLCMVVFVGEKNGHGVAIPVVNLHSGAMYWLSPDSAVVKMEFKLMTVKNVFEEPAAVV